MFCRSGPSVNVVGLKFLSHLIILYDCHVAASCRKLGITKLGPLLMVEGISKCRVNWSVGYNVGPAPTNTRVPKAW